MAQELYMVAFIAGTATGLTVASQVLGEGPIAWAVALTTGVMAAVLWVYSPAPNRTVFGGMGTPEAGYWGFSRQEESDNAE